MIEADRLHKIQKVVFNIKKHFLLVGCVIGMMQMVGCTAPSADQSQGTEGPRIALVMKSLANEFFSTMAEGAKNHQKTSEKPYQLLVNGIKDERDLSRQVALVEEMIAQGVDAIVIAPADSKALVPVLRRATEAGIIVVNIDNKLDDEVLKSSELTIPFVGPDNRKGARLVGDYLAEQLSEGDPVAVLEGIRTSFNGQQRRLGFEEAMEAAGMKIVDSQSAQWEMSQANVIASAMLSEHPDLTAILASNDSMALGALAAVKAAGRADKVKIVGFDNISAVQQAIRDGQILATADQHGDQLAVFGIEYALDLLAENEETPVDRETPVDLITAEVLKQ
ncbi:Ribose ABC transport system, periplasmic ribose-binding protein RbsB [Planctomycetales bacterium 10988]|nr:Ribose ABC transport system, periplasmic ribose-binding protein RbsB [Planctomycetales bacterium 10988]